MNTPNTPTDEPTTEWEFQRALSHLIQLARDNGIRVCGGWAIDGGDAPTDFGVEIYRVVRDRSTEKDAAA